MDKSARDGRSPETVASAIFSSARLDRKLPAFAVRGGPAITYNAALLAVDRIASALTELGITDQDRVAFMAPRGALGIVGFLGVSSVAICCPLNPRLRAEELAATIQAMRITALVDVESGSVAQDMAKAGGLPLLLLNADGHALDLSMSLHGGRYSGRSQSGCAPEVAMMMQTSGTTSKPKLVALTHQNILSAAGAIRGAFSLNERDLCLNPMPLHHVHGLISAGISSLLSGSQVACTDNFSTKAFESIFEECRPTWFTCSPAMHLALLEHFKGASRKPSRGSLRFLRSSSAPLPASAIGELETLFDAPLIETYGLTESASMICSNPLPPAVRKLGSVGIAFGADIRISDETGIDKPANQNGEILVRGPSVIRQYDASGGDRSDSFFDDWLRTGDVGYLDEDRYLFIVGRTKELIKRGGLSVYPAEIDNALTSHADVAEAVAFSVPHPTMGEELVAAVVPRAGTSPTDRQLRAYVAGQLSTYKVPTVILVVDVIPKNETGKILRREMPRALADHLQSRGQPPETAAEAALFDAWKTVMGRDDFGVTDNVFLLGADPLRAERVTDLLKSTHQNSISARLLIANPSIRDQAALISATPEGTT